MSGVQDPPPAALGQRVDRHHPPLAERVQLRQGGPYQEIPTAQPLGHRVVVAVVGNVAVVGGSPPQGEGGDVGMLRQGQEMSLLPVQPLAGDIAGGAVDPRVGGLGQLAHWALRSSRSRKLRP